MFSIQKRGNGELQAFGEMERNNEIIQMRKGIGNKLVRKIYETYIIILQSQYTKLDYLKCIECQTSHEERLGDSTNISPVTYAYLDVNSRQQVHLCLSSMSPVLPFAFPFQHKAQVSFIC